MLDNSRLIFPHGLISDGNSSKARVFREWFPGMLTPDFNGSFEERMIQLNSILADKDDWSLIGSSFGGLMGTVFTCKHPSQVRKLILLAPALLPDHFGSYLDLEPVPVPTIIIHGTLDDVVPLEPVREVARDLFTELTNHVVEDDHRLYNSVNELDWNSLLK